MTQQARHAEALGARLPPLQVAAARVAATVWQGVHGRRRVGVGEGVWQFRPYLAGDEARRIDWRKSARADALIVRETEWEAAQTVCLWRDGSPSMHWRSKAADVEKVARAEVLLLALAALLLRGGERVRLLGSAQVFSGAGGLDRMAAALSGSGASLGAEDGLPLTTAAVPRHGRVVLIGDFLAPPEAIAAAVGRLAALPTAGHLLQVLDPAELDLPYRGRVRFTGLEQEVPTLVRRVDGLRGAYAARLAAQQQHLAGIAAGVGWGFGSHRTDHPPEAALLALYLALSGERVGR